MLAGRSVALLLMLATNGLCALLCFPPSLCLCQFANAPPGAADITLSIRQPQLSSTVNTTAAWSNEPIDQKPWTAGVGRQMDGKEWSESVAVQRMVSLRPTMGCQQ